MAFRAKTDGRETMNSRWIRLRIVLRLAGVGVALLLLAPSGGSATINAKATAGWTTDSQDKDMDPDVSSTKGTFVIETAAQATDNTGAMVSARNRWPAAGGRNKALLLKTRPVLQGTDANPKSGQHPDYAESGAVKIWSRGYAYGLGYLDEFWIDEYEFKAHAFAAGSAGRHTGFGEATITDPDIFAWSDDDSHTLISSFTLHESMVQAEPNPEGYSRAGIQFVSSLDLDNDGGFDQLFWSLRIEINQGVPLLDLTLGDGVFLDGGATEVSVERLLGTFYSSEEGFRVPGDMTIPFAYAVSARPGGGAVALDLNNRTYADVGSVPESANTLILMALALAAAVGIGDQRGSQR